MKNILFTTTVITSILFLSCKKESIVKASSFDQSLTAKTGSVNGKATDSRGNPLQGVDVTIEHTVWLDTYLFGTTNKKGKYNISIPADPAGDWTAKARYSKSAYGQNYLFDMDGSTAYFAGTDSTIRNFTWKLSGKKPGGGYYGAHVDLYQFGTDADMTKVKIVFTPLDSTLIDGSPVSTFERTVEDVAGTFMVKDVPIGKYSIKAKYPGKKLLLDNRNDDKEPARSKKVIFGKYGYLGDTEYNIEFWVSE